MCTFISLTLDSGADIDRVRPVFARFCHAFDEMSPPQDIPAARRYFAHATHACDCGTAIGGWSIEDVPPYDADDVAKLRRKGWSEARIERWKTQKLGIEAKDERGASARLDVARGELAWWVAFVRALLETPTVSVVGLMHGEYASGPGHEEHPLTVEAPRPMSELSETRLFHLPAGVLAEWKRQRTALREKIGEVDENLLRDERDGGKTTADAWREHQ